MSNEIHLFPPLWHPPFELRPPPSHTIKGPPSHTLIFLYSYARALGAAVKIRLSSSYCWLKTKLFKTLRSGLVAGDGIFGILLLRDSNTSFLIPGRFRSSCHEEIYWSPVTHKSLFRTGISLKQTTLYVQYISWNARAGEWIREELWPLTPSNNDSVTLIEFIGGYSTGSIMLP